MLKSNYNLLFCGFKAVVAAFYGNHARAAHFHDAVWFHKLDESVDLRSFARQFADKSRRGIIDDLRAEYFNRRHDILTSFRRVSYFNEKQFPNNGFVAVEDFNLLDVVKLLKLADDTLLYI